MRKVLLRATCGNKMESLGEIVVILAETNRKLSHREHRTREF